MYYPASDKKYLNITKLLDWKPHLLEKRSPPAFYFHPIYCQYHLKTSLHRGPHLDWKVNKYICPGTNPSQRLPRHCPVFLEIDLHLSSAGPPHAFESMWLIKPESNHTQTENPTDAQYSSCDRDNTENNRGRAVVPFRFSPTSMWGDYTLFTTPVRQLCQKMWWRGYESGLAHFSFHTHHDYTGQEHAGRLPVCGNQMWHTAILPLLIILLFST